MPICGIHTTLCGKAEEFLSTSPEKLEKLESIKQQLLGLEEKKLENGNLVRLLEEEIRKQQIRLSIKPKTSAFLLSRARNSSYWISSNPELYKTLQCSSSETEDNKYNGDDEFDDTASNWSEISERYSARMPKQRKKRPVQQDIDDMMAEDEEVQTISSDIVHHLLYSTNANKNPDLEQCDYPTKRSLKDRKFVQVTHSRNVSGFFGDYSLYHCTLHTVGGKVISNEKRYSDFVSLRESLVKSFSFPPSALPDFPQKKVIGKFKEDFISQRRQGLEDFMNSVYLKYSQDINTFIEMWLTSCKN
ncbi:uncharacterized protein LOC134811261 [Bolinopsis microptera]|uniref:uncharacterized protein LOC134811261 n=1 Tax=Bolinopsis microptera TaxID=2820187 RepID=UPI00307A8CC5